MLLIAAIVHGPCISCNLKTRKIDDHSWIQSIILPAPFQLLPTALSYENFIIITTHQCTNHKIVAHSYVQLKIDVKLRRESVINTSACLGFLSAPCPSAYHYSAFRWLISVSKRAKLMVLTHIAKKNVGHGLGHDRFGHGRGSHHHGTNDGREMAPKPDHQDPRRMPS